MPSSLRLLLESDLTTLHVYDFDNTLFKSPEKPDWWAKDKGWWGRLESLTPPCVPEKPDSSWWNPAVVRSAKESLADAQTLTVLATGRHTAFKSRVEGLLGQAGLRFDHVYLSQGSGSTLEQKIKLFGGLLDRHSGIREVAVWEDREEHVVPFEHFFVSRGMQVTMNHVKSARRDVACAPF